MELLQQLDTLSTFFVGQEMIRAKMETGHPLKIKLGADPSRPDLHLGHSVILLQLKKLQDLGHDIFFIIGDYTGMVGDPTNKKSTRPSLTLEETIKNGETYYKQVTKILDEKKTKILYNSNWLQQLGLKDVIELMSHYTVAQLLERDDFAKRFATHTPIHLHELLYPLIQGYDSIAIEADWEFGGTDQTFNLLVGRALQKHYQQPQQAITTLPLLIGLDGKEKMSKSLDNYIGLCDAPENMYEKCMRIPDAVLESYFELATLLEKERYISFFENKSYRDAHFLLADTIVTMYHGIDKMETAKKRYITISHGNIPTILEKKYVSSTKLLDVLKEVGFVSSFSEGRRLITQRGIKIDTITITDLDYHCYKNEYVLQKGKNKFFHIVSSPEN